jgi:hypothetical protein
MGASASRTAVAVGVDELPRRLDARLQAKYGRGMRVVLPALTSAFGIFVALQQIAVEISGAVSAKLAACAEGRAGLLHTALLRAVLPNPNGCRPLGGGHAVGKAT